MRLLSIKRTSVVVNMTCDYQILSALFWPYVRNKIHLSPGLKYNLSMFNFLWFPGDFFHFRYVQYTVFSACFRRNTYLSFQVSDSSVRKISSIHCHAENNILHKIPALFALFLGTCFYLWIAFFVSRRHLSYRSSSVLHFPTSLTRLQR